MFELVYHGNVKEFEDIILAKAEHEIRKGRPGIRCRLADEYARKLTIIVTDLSEGATWQ